MKRIVVTEIRLFYRRTNVFVSRKQYVDERSIFSHREKLEEKGKTIIIWFKYLLLIKLRLIEDNVSSPIMLNGDD